MTRSRVSRGRRLFESAKDAKNPAFAARFTIGIPGEHDRRRSVPHVPLGLGCPRAAVYMWHGPPLEPSDESFGREPDGHDRDDHEHHERPADPLPVARAHRIRSRRAAGLGVGRPGGRHDSGIPPLRRRQTHGRADVWYLALALALASAALILVVSPRARTRVMIGFMAAATVIPGAVLVTYPDSGASCRPTSAQGSASTSDQAIEGVLVDEADTPPPTDTAAADCS